MTEQTLDLLDLTALSPLDGRYQAKTASLRPYFSEYGLIKSRVVVEVEWLIHLSRQSEISEVPEFSSQTQQFLRNLLVNFDVGEAARIKQIEKITNHDVKAVEYYLKEKVTAYEELKQIGE